MRSPRDLRGCTVSAPSAPPCGGGAAGPAAGALWVTDSPALGKQSSRSFRLPGHGCSLPAPSCRRAQVRPPPGWSRRCRCLRSSRWGWWGITRALPGCPGDVGRAARAGRPGRGAAVPVGSAKGASLSLPPAVHPVLGAARGDDLRQEAIRWVRRPGRPLPAPPRPPRKGTLKWPGRHFPPPARPRSCQNGLAGVKTQIPVKCAFLPAKLAFPPFWASPQERSFPPGVREVVF